MSLSDRHPLRVCPLLIASLLWWCSAAWAANLEGRTTLGRSAVSSALVRARDIDGPRVFITHTDANGRYLLKGLDPGFWLLEVEVDGQLAYREKIEVSEPTTKRDIALKTADSVPYVSIQIVGAADDAEVFLNEALVLRWRLDGSETRKFALKPGRNPLAVRVTPPAGRTAFWSSRVQWRYHLVIQPGGGQKRPYEDAQPVASADQVVVLEGTLFVDDAGKVTLQAKQKEKTKDLAPASRLGPVQF